MKKKKRIIFAGIVLIGIIILLCAFESKTQVISSMIGGITNNNEASTSAISYYHFDIRVDGYYELSDGTTGTATVDEIVAVNQTTSEKIALSMSSALTKDENSSDDVYEYKSLVGHAQGENVGLTSNDTVEIDLVFTYRKYYSRSCNNIRFK